MPPSTTNVSRKIASLEGMVQKLKGKVSDLKSKIEEKDQQLANQGQAMQQTAMENENNKMTIKSFNIPGHDMHKEVTRLNETLALTEFTLKEYQKGNEEHAKTYEKNKKKIAGLEARIKDLLAKIKELEATAPKSTSTTGKVTDDSAALANLKAKYDTLETDFMVCKVDLGVLKKNLEKVQKDKEKYKKGFGKLSAEKTNLENENAKLRYEMASLKDNMVESDPQENADAALALELEQAKEEVLELQKTKKTLLDHLKQAHDALREAGKVADFEISGSVKFKIKKYIRTGGYHWTKFCSTDLELKEFAEEVYDKISDLPDMQLNNKKKDTFCAKDKFVRIYKQVIAKDLSDRRSYSQSRGMDALIVFYNENGWFPTEDDILNIYDLPEDTNSDAYKRKLTILLWYFDCFVPNTVGSVEFYNEGICHYKRATATTKIWGTKTKHVTLHDEAMACLIYENCLPKWKEIVPHKAVNKEWSIPMGKGNKKYTQTKYSDPNSGQVKGRGWKDEGYDAFIRHCERIQEIRDKDQENGHKLYQFCLDLMRSNCGITGKRPPATGGGSGNKRGRAPAKKAAPVTPMKKVVENFETSGDDYSLASEDTSGEGVEGDE